MKGRELLEKLISTQEYSYGKKSLLESREMRELLQSLLGDVYDTQPNPQDFVDISPVRKPDSMSYDRDVIDHDLAVTKGIQSFHLEQYDRLFAEDVAERRKQIKVGSEVLQALLVDCFRKWFKSCDSIITSEYDDLNNGADAAVKAKEYGNFGLAIDFTAAGGDVIFKKLEKNFTKHIVRPAYTVLKYFWNAQKNEKGPLYAAKVVVAATPDDVESVLRAYLDVGEDALMNHSFKFSAYTQIKLQVDYSTEYLEKELQQGSENPILSSTKTQYDFADYTIRAMRKNIGWGEKRFDPLIMAYLENNESLKEVQYFIENRINPLLKKEE